MFTELSGADQDLRGRLEDLHDRERPAPGRDIEERIDRTIEELKARSPSLLGGPARVA